MILVDTNVLSESSKPQGDAAVTDWLKAHHDQIYVPAIVFSELRYGYEIMPKSAKRGAMERWFGDLMLMYSERTIPFDLPVAEVHGVLRASLKRLGKPMNAADGMIAASALAHGLPVATRNVKDFRECGVEVVNPWGG